MVWWVSPKVQTQFNHGGGRYPHNDSMTEFIVSFTTFCWQNIYFFTILVIFHCFSFFTLWLLFSRGRSIFLWDAYWIMGSIFFSNPSPSNNNTFLKSSLKRNFKLYKWSALSLCKGFLTVTLQTCLFSFW